MRRELFALAAIALVIACRTDPEPYQVVALGADTLAVAPLAQRMLVIDGFARPQSVTYDANQDVYFVSNTNGADSAKDDNGYITRIDAGLPSNMETFIAGGRNGVTLHAPKGMALHRNVLWVADIDALRGFDRSTGKPIATIDMSAHDAIMLNDIAVGADGALYVTDSGVVMTDQGAEHVGGDRVFVIRTDGTVRVLAEGAVLGRPSGITWDTHHNRLLVASSDPGHSEIYTLSAAGAREVLASGPGKFDGIEMLQDGRFVVTCWNDHSIHLYGDGTHQVIASNLIQPADLALDTRRNRLVVPLVLPGRIEVWQLLSN